MLYIIYVCIYNVYMCTVCAYIPVTYYTPQIPCTKYTIYTLNLESDNYPKTINFFLLGEADMINWNLFYWRSCHGSAKTNLTSIHEDASSIPGLSGLRIQCCRDLWCRCQMRLGPGTAVAVGQAGGSFPNHPPTQGTPKSWWIQIKKKQKKKKKKRHLFFWVITSLWISPFSCDESVPSRSSYLSSLLHFLSRIQPTPSLHQPCILLSVFPYRCHIHLWTNMSNDNNQQ